MQYIQVPKTISYKDLEQKGSLSPSSYNILLIKNKNFKRLGDLITDKQKGQEVLSPSYIQKSRYFFIRNNALQSPYFLPVLKGEGAVPILPSSFIDFKLKKGDILISKDANVGEVAYLNEDLPNFMISGGLVRIKFSEEIKHYVFAFMKNDFFKNQICVLVTSRGATIKHAKSLWLDAVIPFPNQENKEEVIKFVSLLTKTIIRKEAEIRKKYNHIMKMIDKELKGNQKQNKFIYDLPTFEDIREIGRLDAGMLCEDYKKKQFLIENYSHGAQDIFKQGFDFKRGQNLQVSQIGKSIYTDEFKPNFYKLIRPLNLSDFGTVEKVEYLGNPKELQLINRGDIIFSAEGTIGKFCVFIDIDKKNITNIHGITIFREKKDDVESSFLGVFLGYLRDIGVLDYISVGGQGGSLAQKYWGHVKISNFPRPKKEEIVKYYYNPTNYDKDKLTLDGFEREDLIVTEKTGILQLDKQIKIIKGELNKIIEKIVLDKEVVVSFDFL